MAEIAPHFTGHDNRECGEHRTTGGRAWCFDCSEWCSEAIPCKGCELPALRADRDALKAAIERARAEHAAIHADADEFEQTHNPECECEIAPANRVAADRMLAALDTPTTPESPREHPIGAVCKCPPGCGCHHKPAPESTESEETPSDGN